MEITFGAQKDKVLHQLVSIWNDRTGVDPLKIEKLLKELFKGLISNDTLSKVRVVWDSYIISHSYEMKYGLNYFSFLDSYVKKPSDFSIKVSKIGAIFVIFDHPQRATRGVTYQEIVDDVLCTLSALLIYDNYQTIKSVDTEALIRCFSEQMYSYDPCEKTNATILFFPSEEVYYMNGVKKDAKVAKRGKGWVVVEIDEGYISLLTS